MLVRVATKDDESAKLLVLDLIGLFGGEHVSLQKDGEVQLQLRGAINGALVNTLKAIERWLEQTRSASAQLSVGERSYTVEHPQREDTSTSFSRSNGSSSSRPVVNRGDDSRKAVGRR
jgi:hypothetical protein